jgi:hypothetical protein
MSRLFEHNADPATHVPSRPVVVVEEGFDGIRVRVTVGSADLFVRATWGGRRFSVGLSEGDGEVDVEWSIHRTREGPVAVTGPFVQSGSAEGAESR